MSIAEVTGFDRTAVLRPAGRLDREAAPRLRQEIQILLRGGQCRITVDLAAVDSIDASCLGALLACRTKARERGGDLTIANPNDQVATILHMANLAPLLRCVESPAGQRS